MLYMLIGYMAYRQIVTYAASTPPLKSEDECDDKLLDETDIVTTSSAFLLVNCDDGQRAEPYSYSYEHHQPVSAHQAKPRIKERCHQPATHSVGEVILVR